MQREKDKVPTYSNKITHTHTYTDTLANTARNLHVRPNLCEELTTYTKHKAYDGKTQIKLPKTYIHIHKHNGLINNGLDGKPAEMYNG